MKKITHIIILFIFLMVGASLFLTNNALAETYIDARWEGGTPSSPPTCPSPFKEIDESNCVATKGAKPQKVSSDPSKLNPYICCGSNIKPGTEVQTGSKDANSQDTWATKMKTAKFNAKYLPSAIETTSFANFLSSIYTWGIGIVGILAFAQLVRGGITYMISGAIDKKAEAKTIITDALMGLGLALASVLILYIINPALTKISDVELTSVSVEKSKINIGGEGGSESPTGSAPTGSTTKCMTFEELQSYVDNDYTCGATGLECPSGQGSYNCLAPSTTPDCSIYNYDSPKCAGNSNRIECKGTVLGIPSTIYCDGNTELCTINSTGGPVCVAR